MPFFADSALSCIRSITVLPKLPMNIQAAGLALDGHVVLPASELNSVMGCRSVICHEGAHA
jgi:hypothetical protein